LLYRGLHTCDPSYIMLRDHIPLVGIVPTTYLPTFLTYQLHTLHALPVVAIHDVL
jgi:hypothetical protein